MRSSQFRYSEHVGVGAEDTIPNSPTHLRVTAEAMPQILIDRARQHQRARYGGGRHRLPLSEVGPVVKSQPDGFLAVDLALERFSLSIRSKRSS